MRTWRRRTRAEGLRVDLFVAIVPLTLWVPFCKSILELKCGDEFREAFVKTMNWREQLFCPQACSRQRITGSATSNSDEHRHGVYLVEQSKHVSQQVWDRHVQELSKVVQVQLLALQLPGPVAVLLQDLPRVLRLQPGTARGKRSLGQRIRLMRFGHVRGSKWSSIFRARETGEIIKFRHECIIVLEIICAWLTLAMWSPMFPVV